MAAGRYDFTIEQGADLTIPLTYKDSAGALVNLTGYTAKMKIKDPTGAVLVSLTNVANPNTDVLTLGGVLGTVTIFISRMTTLALSFKEGTYDLELVDGAGKTTRLIQGIITYSAGITL